jgi:selenocysteine-specific elongation factor
MIPALPPPVSAHSRALTLGTAGHIDHGKTTLVKALTGRDTDRLKEEKERGISIELGFAELFLPSGRRVSVVDVPGHERFVKNMVSGATGIDLFVLVVAADDGVMPQTREHLRIIELLEIPLGLVALTKIDMVDAEMVELAAADTEDFLAITRYAGAPVVPVSGVTGEGLPALLEALDVLAAQAPVRRAYPATRLPVDRVFSMKGIGTVITGTLWSGSLRPEDTVSILPPLGSESLDSVRVRGIQVHDASVVMAQAGQRVALNLTGIDREEVQRGQWVVKDAAVEPTYRRRRAPHACLPRAGGPRDQGGSGQGGAGRPGIARSWGFVLRPVALRGEGPGVSRGPFHPALADAGDHHRGRSGVRSGATQARHRPALAGPAGGPGGGTR